jgi:hypothetical protein
MKMSRNHQIDRERVSSHGTFLSIPAVFEGANEGLKHAFKMEFSPIVSEAEGSGKDSRLSFRTAFLTDRAMLDYGASNPDSINMKQVERDCDLLKAALQEHPHVLRQALYAIAGGGQGIDQIKAAAEALESIGLSEQHAADEGGGFVALVLLAGAVLLCAGCSSCAHTSAGHQPPEYPHPLPQDAGPG